MSKLIFLDTEYSSVTHELAQLSYILMQNGKTTCKNFYFCVNEMDESAYRIHHLSKEWLDEYGTAPAAVKAEVLADFADATLIAHNLNADKAVLTAAFGPLPNAYGLCTMYRFAKALKLPGGRPYKMPSLRELMVHYGVDEGTVTAHTQANFACDSTHHDARWDAQAVCLCAAEAMRRGDCRNLLEV